MQYSQEEIEEAGLHQFTVFLAYVWEYLRLPEPTEVQLDIARYLQYGPNRSIIQAFRGVGKSWITVAFVCWILFLDPNKNIKVVSAGEGLAGDFTKFCLQLIRGMPLLKHLEPDPKKGQKASTEKFDVGPSTANKDSSVMSVGITGQLTGGRSDVIVMDDIEIPKNSYTPLLRERLFKLVEEPDNLLKPLPTSRIVYLGTPQVEQSLYTRLHKERKYAIRIWPAEVPPDPNKYNGNLAPMVMKMFERGVKPGTPIEPKRFPRHVLDEKLAGNGFAGYQLQFMLDTTPSDSERHPLKLKDLVIMDCDLEMAPIKVAWTNDSAKKCKELDAGGFNGDHLYLYAYRSDEMANYSQTVMAIDPSGKGTDETAFVILKFCHGMLYLMDAGGYKDGFGDDTLRALAGKAVRWGVNDIIIEKNYGGGMFDSLLKPWLIKVGLEKETELRAEGLPTDKVRHGKIDDEYKGFSQMQKELRILDTLEPVVRSHKLVVSREVLESDARQAAIDPSYSLIFQFTRMQRQRGALAHDDRVDALSMAVAYFVEKMSRDQDRALDEEKEKRKEAALRHHMQHVVGRGKAQRRGWKT
jgi:hypothetical protein